MKIILKTRLENYGEAGDVVEVADGYARNYLIPKEIAVPATDNNIEMIEEIKEQEEKRLAREKEEAEMIIKQIEKTSCEFERLADDNGHLYGSVSENDIVKALEEQDLKLDKSDVKIEHHLKEVGDHKVPIEIKGVTGNLNVKIEEEKKQENKQEEE